LTGALTDTNKAQQNYDQEQHKNLNK